MGTAFSKKAKKGPSITSADKALLSLKAQRKKLNDQQKLLELRITRHSEVARQLVREKHNDKALLVLKKKRLVEKQLEELGNMQITMESLISNVELGQQTNQVFQALKRGNDVLQQLQKEVTVEDVHKLMEDTAEAKAYQDEMAAALSQSLTGEDSSEVEAELQALEDEALQQQVESMPKAPAVPEGQKVAAAAASQEQKAQEAVAAAAEEEEQEVEEAIPTRTALLAA